MGVITIKEDGSRCSRTGFRFGSCLLDILPFRKHREQGEHRSQDWLTFGCRPNSGTKGVSSVESWGVLRKGFMMSGDHGE